VEKSTESARIAMVPLVRAGLWTIADGAMIIACPACGTRYAVPDSAIGSEGRTVRCAKCKHSWFQEPAELGLPPRPQPAALADTPAPAPVPADDPASTPEQPRAAKPAAAAGAEGPSVSHWRTDEAEQAASGADGDASIAVRALRRGLAQHEPDGQQPRTPEPPLSEDAALGEYEQEPPFADEDEDQGGVSQFDYRAPFTQRRNTLKMWTMAAALFALLAAGTMVAVNYFGMPDWAPFSRPAFGVGKPGLELDFPSEEQRSETLENGDKIFRVRGTISNTARETLAVPNLMVVFSDARERKVGDWVVVPAKRELAPGESVSVTEAIANIPPGAAVADLGWAPR
jgi:predicted Zn finger-like uncharacterized protein